MKVNRTDKFIYGSRCMACGNKKFKGFIIDFENVALQVCEPCMKELKQKTGWYV